MQNLTIAIFLMLFVGSNAVTESPMETGWLHWAIGDILKAQLVAEDILKDAPMYNEALHLQSLILLVQGKYQQAVKTFSTIDTTYDKYSNVAAVMVEAYLHLNDLQNAYKLAKKVKRPDAGYIQKRADKPFSCNANKTFIIPFDNDPNLEIPSNFFPSIDGKINQKEVNIGFDTGASFLGIGKEAAEELGISLGFKFIGKHGPRSVTHWRDIAEKLQLGDGLVFKNVPVAIAESLGQQVIFGTNILEQFLATIDYPNSRFILTPRNRKDLYQDHLALLPKKQEILPFYMWSDHYMFAKGSFNKIDNLNFFFDSGLVALTDINGKITQAPFTASKKKLISWGFGESKLNNSTFFPTEYPLAVKNLVQKNTLIWYDVNLEEDRNFGGVRIDGLISHGFLSKYSWTIDFDKHKYIFGVY
jgi:tetratricopeptide (TPR) repeat protein